MINQRRIWLKEKNKWKKEKKNTKFFDKKDPVSELIKLLDQIF